MCPKKANPKYLIVCCDGTWNTPDQEDNGIPAPTNVVKLRNCLAATTTNSAGLMIEQRCYYHTGVGTEGGLLARIFAGAWGRGLNRNIQSAYYWLARNFQKGDSIFLFGFSRGAYTVRSLAGLIARCGLLNLTGLSEHCSWERTKVTFEEGYRRDRQNSEWAGNWEFYERQETRVRFIGVWDTVGALGVPDTLPFINLFDRPKKWFFHDTSLGNNVEIARHAVALDEIRASFSPTLWTSHCNNSDVAQVWFPGVHGDVGGGYAETGLSDGALHWMMTEAGKAGLSFKPSMLTQIAPNASGVLHNSFKGLFKRLRSRPRNTPPVIFGLKNVDWSAIVRNRIPPIAQAPYRPTKVLGIGQVETVDIFARKRWNSTGIYLNAGQYELNASGEWVDRNIPCGPQGADDGKCAHCIGTVLGYVERCYHCIKKNERADFWGTRRHENYPWLSLVGAVANADHAPGADGTPLPHETFRIGKQHVLILTKPGYLYAYVNDAWHFYYNNRGSLKLSVTRLP